MIVLILMLWYGMVTSYATVWTTLSYSSHQSFITFYEVSKNNHDDCCDDDTDTNGVPNVNNDG